MTELGPVNVVGSKYKLLDDDHLRSDSSGNRRHSDLDAYELPQEPHVRRSHEYFHTNNSSMTDGDDPYDKRWCDCCEKSRGAFVGSSLWLLLLDC